MANVNRINGFRPVGTLAARPWTERVIKMYHAAGANLNLNVGDVVKFSGTADADGVPGCLICGAGEKPCGVIVGICPSIDNLVYPYMPGLVEGYVMVCVDPHVIMEVQSSTAVAAASVGLNASLVQTVPAANSLGTSGQELNGGTLAGTATLVFQVIGFAQRPDNTPAAAYNKVLVTFNVHQFLSVGTLGV